MAGPQSVQVAVVQHVQLGFVGPLDDCEYPLLDKPHIGFSIPVTDFGDTPAVLRLQFLDAIGAGDNVVFQGDNYSRVHADVHPGVHLHQ
jgi:hypothetical protein